MRSLVILVSVGLCVPAMAQQRPPSATEVFDLRSKCAELGGKILEGIDARMHPTLSQVSHYDHRTNRCYVEVTEQSGSTYHRYLYDGQIKEILAHASTIKGKREGEISDNQHNPTGNTGNKYDEASKYIDEMMAEDRK
jgi:hypothetical protein